MPGLQRFDDWPARLDRFLASHQRVMFSYGRLDCCLFVADAIIAMTGTDIAAAYRGAYTSRKQILSRIDSVQSVVSAIAAAYAMPEVSPLSAQRGDMTLIRRSRDHSLGLISLNGREVLALAHRGIIRISLDRAICAWRVR